MKKMILGLVTMAAFGFLTTPAALAQKAKEKISLVGVCEKLIAQANAECGESMCADQTEETGEDCVMDGDFEQGRQICVSESMPSMIEQFNKKNKKKLSGKKLNCDGVN